MNKPLRTSHPVFEITNNALVDFPAPRNISRWWNFVFSLVCCLIIQILTGLFLAIHYTADVRLACNRVNMCWDVNYGWLLRTIQANGASFFFICIYLHEGRGIYYCSYLFTPSSIVWVLLLFLVKGTAPIGSNCNY